MSLNVIDPKGPLPLNSGVLVVDTDKVIVYADHAAAGLLGYTPEQLIGKCCAELKTLLPCANSVCGIDSPCRFLEEGKPGEVQVRSNSVCSFESHLAVNGSGDRLGTIHVVSLPKPVKSLKAPQEGNVFEGMIGAHPSMKKVFELVALVAGTDVTVHICGPSGVGKELVAEAVHRLGTRSEKRLVKLNCSTIPTTLLESTLFGHAKGSFTGANKDTEGYVEYAEGGTLFLDEIGDVSTEVQVKLLRLLESREFARVGETRTRFADIRIVTATNRDLRQLVEQGKIREDFFYRVNVFPLVIPPLKERKSDVVILAQYFVERFNKRLRKNILGLSPEAIALLEQHNWPGNVRELQHAIEHAFVKAANGYLLPEHFPLLDGADSAVDNQQSIVSEKQEGQVINEGSIKRELSAARGNASRAAKNLGISRVTLWKHMKRLGITR